MLSKRERFTREQLSTFLEQKGLVVIYNQLGTLKFLKGQKRLSVVTSGKHEKRAVHRNRIRRRIYTLFQSTSKNISGVLYVSKQSYGFEHEKIKNLFNELFSKTS